MVLSIRMIDITAVRWAMKYLVHVRNKVHHYNVPSLFNALDRPEGVGLLTVCNHVSTLDSASLVPAMIPSRFLHCSDVPVGCVLSSRNCGYWNLAAEEIMFSSPLKAALSSLIKVDPVSLCEVGVARRSQRRRVSYGTRGLRAARHLRRLDPHVPGRPDLPRSADELSRCSRTTLPQERPHSASWTRSGSDEMGRG